ncbi:RNA binding (RRM/RBD/RNP motifs) family protein [Striga asiatica]|uniref:RNA binding (RRM/RBD/RNP motifs) family protein n=1 Tax=Striga asiatica TaxID=4170 RepID=A0A5A7R0A2_STRAF|nr:RNA binding (RRM/RBD/RNP motifs) family protein [Striga asiatica]
MSDEGDKTCPLCAEEMDLTDQQLKPCKCGYEICVWCWHHIMDMAEKDETQGRCPACRTPYNKERIVGTAAKCEKLVTELNVEKKLKLQKGKGKTLEGRKQLESVRVIQRNLVYVVGLPLNYADEEILQRKDYFSQYGKVLKVSISRTATGAIQQFANNTCSVYITYSKEEEAVRCIQLVHGFVLDGKPLRACFGTTKYCHAWLRNMPCSNKDCLYLHEIGSQEDSFTKDEIISAYTRNRVQQTTGSSNSTQRRVGNVLPPPGDEYCNISSTSVKPIPKAAINTNNVACSARVSPPNSSSGRSAALPAGASWGTRPANNSQPSPTSTPYFNVQPNPKPDISNSPVAISKKSSSASQISTLQSDTGKKKVQNQENSILREKTKKETSGSKERESNAECRIPISDGLETSVHLMNLPSNRQPRSPPQTSLPPNSSNLVESSVLSSGSMPDNKSVDHVDGNLENVCSTILSMSIHENKEVQNGYVEHNRGPLFRQISAKAVDAIDDRCGANVQSDFGPGMQSKVTQLKWHGREDDVLSFDNQRINDPEVATGGVQECPDVLNLSKHSNTHSDEFSNVGWSVGSGFNRQVVDRNGNLVVPTLNFPSARSENLMNSFEGNDAGNFNLFPTEERRPLLGRYEGEASNSGADMGESSIISNILSMDFDPWNESLTSPQNLAKLLGETDKREGSFGVSGPWKIHNSNQSRFSFAREGETPNHVSGSEQSIDYIEQNFRQHPFGHDISSSNSLYLSASRNGLPVFGGTEPDNFVSSNSHISSNKLSASRSHISAPPGFSVPGRAAPPPGFTFRGRTEPIFEPLSGNHMHGASSSLRRNQYQTPPNSNAFSNGDIEFMDPAILAVGKGTLPGGINKEMMSNFPPQLNTYEDVRFQSLLQRSLPHQNQRLTNELGESFSTLVDAYGLPSRIADQTLSSNLPTFSQFNLPHPRNGINPSGNNSGMAELLKTERLVEDRTFLKMGSRKPTGKKILRRILDMKAKQILWKAILILWLVS